MSKARRNDLLVGGLSLILALWVTSGFWVDPARKASFVNSGDQALFEWLLSYGAYALTHFQDPLFTYLLNVPDGVNLAVNTSITAYAIAFTPITMGLGPTASFLIILTLNLAASAWCWYYLFSRHLNASSLGAAVGGLFAGFAPAMISHANAHLNWTAQWIIPLIIARVIVMYRRRRPVRDGLILGILIAVAFSLAAEALFFAALALALFCLIWYPFQRTPIKHFLAGLGVAALTAGVLLAYPLYLHFAGPQRYHGTGFDPKVHNEDLAAYWTFPERSLAGALGLNDNLAPNPTEENSFLGAPLLALAFIGFVLLWRRAEVKALAVVTLVFAVLSLGPELRYMKERTDMWMPEALLVDLPIFNAALPSRLALVVAPIIALVLAWLISKPKPGPKWVWVAGFTVALLPLVPQPILTRDREPVPHFFSAGVWESYVDGEGVVAPIPLPNDLVPDGQRWQATVLAQGGRVFRLPSGFFLGPGGPDGAGRIGPVPRPTADLLEKVARTGEIPPIGAAEQAQAREDLRYWDAQIVVLADTVSGAHWDPNQSALLRATTLLLGPPERIDDVWVWKL